MIEQKLSFDQFMVDYFQEGDDIVVQCLWLQNLIKDSREQSLALMKANDKVSQLLHKIDCLEAKIEMFEMYPPECYSTFITDDVIGFATVERCEEVLQLIKDI